jgi:hypothetical protein
LAAESVSGNALETLQHGGGRQKLAELLLLLGDHHEVEVLDPLVDSPYGAGDLHPCPHMTTDVGRQLRSGHPGGMGGNLT